MKVFISWSGSAAHEAAKALREWLPYLIQKLDPWVSSEDISKGEMGLSSLSQNLQDAGFGIICVTQESARSPWVNFEAGAMANSVGGMVRVAPVLIGLTAQDLSKSPLTQLQHAPFDDKDEMLKLVTSILEVCPESALTKERLNKNFEKFWPELEFTIQKIKTHLTNQNPPKPSTGEKIDELLGLARQSQRRIDRLELAVGPLQHAYNPRRLSDCFDWTMHHRAPERPMSVANAQAVIAALLGGDAAVDVENQALHVSFLGKPSDRAARLIEDVGDATGIPIRVSYGEPLTTSAQPEGTVEE
ncbi:toll/interleukin-1 receptor domain-containing protein [Streptomyces sp. NBC_00555]|uniref:toll/interleukin-1 receptor domain-containing protein n=1 Tax=Streptomyces sp. NBC_00555 TaxID=2903662 RepID=UPI002252BCCE|nr:toll/interleukin-1 receptor domain-containing protein [Streptomyces sp. NBC_00555]MCX5010380.1 toll/interleukin-1 receptor domain-containing protein [Streptomyces sp. NBC_00555]